MLLALRDDTEMTHTSCRPPDETLSVSPQINRYSDPKSGHFGRDVPILGRGETGSSRLSHQFACHV
jgi:hypothetical protein